MMGIAYLAGTLGLILLAILIAARIGDRRRRRAVLRVLGPRWKSTRRIWRESGLSSLTETLCTLRDLEDSGEAESVVRLGAQVPHLEFRRVEAKP